MSKQYVMRVNVKHNGVDLPKGKLCPEEFVEPLKKQGLLEEVKAPEAAQVASVAPSAGAPQGEAPVGGSEPQEGEEPGSDGEQEEGGEEDVPAAAAPRKKKKAS
jgi:hypothetical protein